MLMVVAEDSWNDGGITSPAAGIVQILR